MERNTTQAPCPCAYGQLGWKWKYQCHLCNSLLCEKCFARCHAGCGQLLCARETWFCVHCETMSCFSCSTCYVIAEIPLQAEDYYCDLCLGREEAAALMGSGWRRKCKEIILAGNFAIYVSHYQIQQKLSDEQLSSEE